MEGKQSSVSGGRGGLDDLPEPDYDHLSFSNFQEEDDDDVDHYPKKPGGKKGKKNAVAIEQQAPTEPPYILGTLIVRIVAARDLQPARNGHNGGLGNFLFGGGRGGSANPYASVKFGSSAQRTSDLYDTLDPVWPRGETMFMDVSLPLSKTTHPGPNGVLSGTTIPGEFWNNQADSSATSGSNGSGDLQQQESQLSSESPTSSLSSAHSGPKNHTDSVDSLDIPQPILTVAVFSASEIGKTHKSIHGSNDRYPNKKGVSGDSDDEFLGMASVDLTSLLTGKRPQVDTWVPLTGASGSVRISCEYEPAANAPQQGDLVCFTRFCHPADLYPLVPGRVYPVQEVVDTDNVLLSYTSPEGWVCSFMVHRFMVLCVERHHGAVEAAREEWQSINERLSHSPLVTTVAQTVQQLPEEGLFAVGANVIHGGAGLLGRWLEGGLDTAVKDVAFATNWDGQSNATTARDNRDDNATDDAVPEETSSQSETLEEAEPPITLPEASPKSDGEKDPLPNMPACPITSEPMLDPVVAADGHTYERSAIARWLQTSDKSPLTGSVLPHKELVPNYGLLSSLQEQADAVRKKAPPVAAPKPAPVVVATKELDEVKATDGNEEEKQAAKNVIDTLADSEEM